ncbi:MAG: hypothetical protein MR384_03995, partial [Lachnospiraceae bacterium]|nr:hypothetical protein [Lachnospiraceae bacterium]
AAQNGAEVFKDNNGVKGEEIKNVVKPENEKGVVFTDAKDNKITSVTGKGVNQVTGSEATSAKTTVKLSGTDITKGTIKVKVGTLPEVEVTVDDSSNLDAVGNAIANEAFTGYNPIFDSF